MVQQQGELYARVDGILRWPMLTLGVAFIIALVLPLQQDTPPAVRHWCGIAETTIWVAFAIEYALLLALARNKALYLRTHVLEAAAVVVPACRLLRLTRLLRLVRLAGIPRPLVLASVSARMLASARGVIVRYKLAHIAVSTVLVLLVTSALMLSVEGMPPTPPWPATSGACGGVSSR